MLVRSLYKTKGIALYLAFLLLFILAYSEKVLSSDIGGQTAIVEVYLQSNSEDHVLAQSLADQARKRASALPNSLNTNPGPLVKLWCDASAIAPNPENLLECARFRFAAVDQMSNPQPSKEVVQMQRARKSLIMIRAALEIAGGNPNVSNALRQRLKRSASCFRDFISGVSAKKNCN